MSAVCGVVCRKLGPLHNFLNYFPCIQLFFPNLLLATTMFKAVCCQKDLVMVLLTAKSSKLLEGDPTE